MSIYNKETTLRGESEKCFFTYIHLEPFRFHPSTCILPTFSGRGGEGTVSGAQGGDINVKTTADKTVVLSSVGLGGGHGGYGGGADHDYYNSGMLHYM